MYTNQSCLCSTSCSFISRLITCDYVWGVTHFLSFVPLFKVQRPLGGQISSVSNPQCDSGPGASGLPRLVPSSVNRVGAARISAIPRGPSPLRLESKALNDQTQVHRGGSAGRVEETGRTQTEARKRKWKNQTQTADFKAPAATSSR